MISDARTRYCPRCESNQIEGCRQNDWTGDAEYYCKKCNYDYSNPTISYEKRSKFIEKSYEEKIAEAKKSKEDAILEALSNGDRILAMKIHRELYGSSMIEAKNFIDYLLK